jgi:hypothetical protein
MDPGPPLVVDNGTGVSATMLKIDSCLTFFAQFVKVGYAGSNFPEHGNIPYKYRQ